MNVVLSSSDHFAMHCLQSSNKEMLCSYDIHILMPSNDNFLTSSFWVKCEYKTTQSEFYHWLGLQVELFYKV